MLSLDPKNSSAHLNLGIALMELGRLHWAIRAFHTSLQISPDNAAPHRCLALIYEKGMDRPKLMAHHAGRAREIAERRRARRAGGSSAAPDGDD